LHKIWKSDFANNGFSILFLKNENLTYAKLEPATRFYLLKSQNGSKNLEFCGLNQIKIGVIRISYDRDYHF
jgi:type II restriction/modification system DNA methylase subunit YeeA